MSALRKHPRPCGVIGTPAVPADLAFFNERFEYIAYVRGLLLRVSFT